MIKDEFVFDLQLFAYDEDDTDDTDDDWEDDTEDDYYDEDDTDDDWENDTDDDYYDEDDTDDDWEDDTDDTDDADDYYDEDDTDDDWENDTDDTDDADDYYDEDDTDDTDDADDYYDEDDTDDTDDYYDEDDTDDTEEEEDSWTLNGTTAKYGNSVRTLLTVSGVNSLDGISLNGSVVTISDDSLNNSNVTVSNGYTLKLDTDVTKPSTQKAWSLSKTTATYKQTTSAGYTLASDSKSIIYSKAASQTLATVTGVKSLDGISLKGNVITVSNAALGTSNLTVSDGYTLALAKAVTKPSDKKAWSLSKGTATYKNTTSAGYTLASDSKSIIYSKSTSQTLATVTGVKSLDGLKISDKTITVSKAALGTSNVTVSDGYTLALAKNVSKPSESKAWSLNKTTATYKQTTSAGYTLANNAITYSKSASKTLATVKGLKSGLKVSSGKINGLSLNGTTVTVSKAALGTSKVTVDNGYTLALAKDVTKPSESKAWSLNKTTATYKQTTSAGYTLANNAITYSKATSQTLATVKGLKSGLKVSSGKINGLSLSGTTVTVSKAALGTSNVTVSKGYTLALAKDVTKSKSTEAGWTKSGSTATYTDASTTKGYTLADNQISYVKASGGKTLATVTGVKNIKGFSLKNNVVTLKKDSLKNKVTVGGSYEFNLASGDYKKTSIMGSASADVITSNGKNLSISGGKGNDTIKISGAGTTVTGGKGDDVFIYNGGNGVITDFASTDKLQIGDGTGTYSATKSGKNLIVTVGKNQMTLTGAASLKSPKITGTKVKPSVIVDGKKATLTEEYVTESFALTKDYSKIQTVDASKVPLGVSITGNKLMNTILGGAGNDTLTGGKGNDSLKGGKGADVFVYSAGDDNDVIADYTEEDTIKISKGTVKRISPTDKDVVFTVGKGKITVTGGRNKVINYVDAKGIEHFYPVDFNAGGTAATLLAAYAKDNFNISDYAEYADTVVKIDASAVEQDVLITANKKNNNILGGKGNDTLIGGKGNDSLDGGEGSDIFVYNKGDGNDTILNYSTEDKIKINVDTAIAPKTSGNDVVLKVGSNKITVKDAKDKIVTYVDKKGNEIGYSDTVVLSNKGKVATLNDKYSKKNFVAGDYGNDIRTIDASKVSKNLSITGSGFADSITGGAGDDTLIGGRGNDTLKGDNGKDVFVYNKGDGNDTITDYSPGDIIKIASSSLADNVEVKGNDVTFTVNNSGTITVKNGKNKKITFVDKNDNTILNQKYTKSTMQTESLWFVEDDTNFANYDNQLGSILKGSAEAYSFNETETALSSVSSLPAISYSSKK